MHHFVHHSRLAGPYFQAFSDTNRLYLLGLRSLPLLYTQDVGGSSPSPPIAELLVVTGDAGSGKVVRHWPGAGLEAFLKPNCSPLFRLGFGRQNKTVPPGETSSYSG